MARRKRNQTSKFIAELIITCFLVVIQVACYAVQILWAGITEFIKSFNETVKEYDETKKYIKEHQLEQEQQEQAEMEQQRIYNNAINRLRTLVSYTENKLYYQVVKTEFPGEGRIREYINFFTYDRQTVAVENANELVNTVLNNVLSVYKGRNSKLHNSIVLDDYACDMKDISRNIAEKIGVEKVTATMY